MAERIRKLTNSEVEVLARIIADTMTGSQMNEIFQECGVQDASNESTKWKRIYYRNLLGGLYRENPVKSRNYEAVKSSKKWENVGNSYIIPALLLYRYSYI